MAQNINHVFISSDEDLGSLEHEFFVDSYICVLHFLAIFIMLFVFCFYGKSTSFELKY